MQTFFSHNKLLDDLNLHVIVTPFRCEVYAHIRIQNKNNRIAQRSVFPKGFSMQEYTRMH